MSVWVEGHRAIRYLSPAAPTAAVAWGPRSPHGNLPSPRFQHATCACPRTGRLFVVGGTNGREFFDDVHVFDPRNFLWTRLHASSASQLEGGGRARHTVTCVGGDLLLFGGICKSGFAPNTLFRLSLDDSEGGPAAGKGGIDWVNSTYSFEELKISIGQEVPSPRFSHCAAAFAKKLYIFGGERKGRKFSNTLFSFDLATNTWQRELQSASAKSMAPPSGKDFRMILLKTSESSGTVHLAVLGTNLGVIHCVPIDTSSGTPISWEPIKASGQVPGASIADSSMTAVHRQFDATLIPRPSPADNQQDDQQQDGDSAPFHSILIFWGIVHNPKSMLTDDTHEL